ncbi:hypothetical protein [Microbispora sp. H10836]|nr:hypothetical protein [Microbispora sp. H10836]
MRGIANLHSELVRIDLGAIGTRELLRGRKCGVRVRAVGGSPRRWAFT